MKAESGLITQMDTLLKRKKKRRLVFFGGWVLTHFLILQTLIFGCNKTGFLPGPMLPLSFFLIPVALVLAWLQIRVTRRSFLSDLIRIDNRLGLEDRLSTAYEYLKSNKTSQLREKLWADAQHTLEKVSLKELYPLHFSSTYVLLPLFSLFIFLIQFTDLTFLPFGREKELDRLAPAGRVMERFLEERSLAQKGGEEASQGEPYRQLEELTQQIQNRSIKKEKLLRTLSEMEKEAQGERLRLTQKLEKELFADPSPPSQGLSNMQDLGNLTEQLNNYFNGRLPDSLAGDLSRIREKLQLENLLGKAIGLTLSPGSAGEDALLARMEEAFTQNNNGQHSAKPPERPGAESPSDQERQTHPSPGKEKSGERGRREGLEGPNQKGGDGFRAGTEKGGRESHPPSALRMGRGEPVQESGIPSGTAPTPSRTVRTAPLFGNSREDRGVFPQEIRRSFRKEKESVLPKEKIPPEYREYIKNYFLSVREEKGTRANDQSR